ncbi:MAG: hypothetical protein HY815_16665 [Candidatus Riflebacteria bacterium]|nr:hypothetical protein [Candidatus Riflebacteria bacterium]
MTLDPSPETREDSTGREQAGRESPGAGPGGRESLLSTLIDKSNDLVLVVDPVGRVQYLNQLGRRTARVAEGAPLDDLHVAALQPQWAGRLTVEVAIPSALAGGTWTGLAAFIDPGGVGSPARQEVYRLGLDERSGVCLGITLKDARREVEIERRLLHAQKLVMAGTLSSRFAHDLNNVLTVILSTCELALVEHGSAAGVREDLAVVQQAAMRGATLTNRLLEFIRSEPTSPEDLSVNAVIHEIRELTWPTRADRCLLEHAIINLSINARDAMPRGGRLTIGTVNVDVREAGEGPTREVPPGRYVVLTVADTGCGMTPEVSRRAFEPFFSTKEEGKGTGLGLASVQAAVASWGGFATVTSACGAGTTVSLHLPRSDSGPRTGGALSPQAVLRRTNRWDR